MSRTATDAVLNTDNHVYLSVVSRWEIAIKQKKPDFAISEPFEQAFAPSSFLPLDLTFDVPAQLVRLPEIHRDPCDHILMRRRSHPA